MEFIIWIVHPFSTLLLFLIFLIFTPQLLQVRRGKNIGVCPSVDNCRLFIGGIPKTVVKEQIMIEMQKNTEGVKDVIVYPSANDKTKNRGKF